MPGDKMKLIILILLLSTTVAAVELPDMDEDEKVAFDQILEPVMRIYSFVKYASTLVAVLVLLFAGINYMISGYDIRKREQAKSILQ
jgi:hypothetical protein